MTRYFRVSLGKGGKYATAARVGGWVGIGWVAGVDLTGKFPVTWKAFNKVYIPVLLETHESTSKIGAGLAFRQIQRYTDYYKEELCAPGQTDKASSSG